MQVIRTGCFIQVLSVEPYKAVLHNGQGQTMPVTRSQVMALFGANPDGTPRTQDRRGGDPISPA